ncbi:MAG: transglycosylase SLT domain-containing protein [Paracoccaceae bacterium]
MRLAVALALALPAASALAGVCEDAGRAAARRHGVPEALMLALARVESGRGATSHPWAMNVGGAGSFPETRAEAEARARRLVARGASFDLGCFQINHRWHGEAFASVEAMLDPAANADYAARFLTRLHAESGDWLTAAGHYHSRTPSLASRYRARVRSAMARLGGGDAPPSRHATRTARRPAERPETPRPAGGAIASSGRRVASVGDRPRTAGAATGERVAALSSAGNPSAAHDPPAEGTRRPVSSRPAPISVFLPRGAIVTFDARAPLLAGHAVPLIAGRPVPLLSPGRPAGATATAGTIAFAPERAR